MSRPQEWQPSAPWTIRLFERAPFDPAWTGVLIVLGYLVVHVVIAQAGGWMDGLRYRDQPFWQSLFFRLAILQALLIGYLPTATAYSVRGAARDLRDLRPALSCTDAEFEEQARTIACFHRGLLLTTGAAGTAIGLVAPFTRSYWGGEPPALLSPLILVHAVQTGLLSWLISRTLVVEILVAVRFSRIGEQWARIDLLDTEPLAPLARRGLRSVLLLMLFVVLFSPLFLAPFSRELNLLAVTLLGTGAAAALVVPALGVHRRIRDQRAEELERVRTAIRRERDARIEPGSGWQPSDARLSDLIVYEGRIASVNTWPFDVSTLLRFSLFLALGVGSWLGGAIVERLLGLALE
jgi:hypothetical protein